MFSITLAKGWIRFDNIYCRGQCDRQTLSDFSIEKERQTERSNYEGNVTDRLCLILV